MLCSLLFALISEKEMFELEIAFSNYQAEHKELVYLLSRWNKDLALFEVIVNVYSHVGF